MKWIYAILPLFFICSVQGQTALEVRGDLINLMVDHGFVVDSTSEKSFTFDGYYSNQSYELFDKLITLSVAGALIDEKPPFDRIQTGFILQFELGWIASFYIIEREDGSITGMGFLQHASMYKQKINEI